MAIGTTQAFRTQNFRLLGNFYDKNNVIGSKGYYLNSVGDGVEWRADINEGTGILTGGVISATIGGTTFNITAGTGQILSKALVGGEVITTNTRVSWNAQNNIALTYRTSHQFSYIYIDENGVLQQQNSSFTDAEYRNKIIVGIICHIDYSTINLVTNKQNVAYNDATRMYELISCFGPIKQSGLSISAYSTDLRITRAAGAVFLLGSNYSTDQFIPDTTTLTAANPALLCRVSRDGSGGFVFDVNSGSYYASIDPTKYDNGSGTLQTVNNNQWTIQRLYFFPNNPNDVITYYGRAVYNSYSDASAGLSTESFSEATITAENAVFLGYLIVRGGATNLSISADATFFQSGAFRNIGTGGGGGGGAAATNLDDLGDVAISSPSDSQFLVYDNSTSLWKNASLTASSPITFTGVGTSLSLSVSNNAISFAKIQQISTSRVLGRISSGTGNIEELTGANIATIIGSNFVTNATNATNLIGGVAGVIPYQSGIGTTAFTSAGTVGQVLLSGGTGAPTWANQNTLSVSSAATLTTTRTLWGQNFNGSANVTGSLSSVGDITGSSSITVTAGGTNQNVTITPSGTGYTLLNGNVGIGTTTPTNTLDVNGTTRVRSVAASGSTASIFLTTDANGVLVSRTAAQVRSDIGAGTGSGTVTSITAGDGLSGGTITSSGTIAVDSTVVRTSGNQTIGGTKTFTAETYLATTSGNVGIGTTSPATTLQIGQLTPTGATSGLQFGDDTGTRIYRSASSTLTMGGTFVATTFSGSGASLTNLPAGQLSGTIPSGVLANSTVYIGTTAIALNRSSASQSLTGITSIDGSAATLTTTRTLWGQNFNGSANVTGSLTSVGDITGSSSITVTAGGTNQNITITPSGTGYTLLNGNVGIGTTTPTNTLDVNGTTRVRSITASGSAASIFLTTDANGVLVSRTAAQVRSDIGAGTGSGTVTSITAGDGLSGGTITSSGTIAVDSTVVRTSGNQTIGGTKTFTAETYLATTSGNVGIGTTIPVGKLDVNGAVHEKKYAIANTAATAQWVKIGRLYCTQEGKTFILKGYIHAGYNALNSQDFSVELFFKTSNTSSVNGNGFAANSWYYGYGFNTHDITPKWVANAAGVNATYYDLYLYLPQFTLGSHYSFSIVNGDASTYWTDSQATGQTDPGSGSSTVLVADKGFNFTLGNVGIGSIAPANKLNVLGSASIGSATYNTAAPTNGLLVEGNVAIGSTSGYTTGGNASLTIGSSPYVFSIGSSNNELMYTRRLSSGIYQLQTYNSANTGEIHLEPYGGNVGIGTTTVSAKLHVNSGAVSSDAFALQIQDATSYIRYIPSVGGGSYNSASIAGGSALITTLGREFWIGQHDGAAIRFASNEDLYFYNGGASPNLTILTGGNVGIGGTSPDALLHVATGHIHVGNSISFDNVGSWNKTILIDGTNHGRLRVRATANAGANNNINEAYFWVDNTVSPYSGIYADYGFKLQTGSGSLTLFAGSGYVGIGTTTPTNTLDINGSTRIRSIAASGSAASIFLTTDANGVVISRTAAQVRSDIGAGTGNGTVTSVTLATGTTGTDVNVSNATITTSGTITLNIPDASATARGLITTGTQTIAGAKTFSSTISGSIDGSAATLTTTRTLWGQNFNGSANVTGSLTSVGNITGSSAITITAGGSNQNITLTPSGSGYTLLNGYVGIGTTVPTSPLHICFDGSVFPSQNVARIVSLSYSGITGAHNWALRGVYQYSAGVANNASGGDLDLIKSLDRNTILATKTDGTALGNVGIGVTTPANTLVVLGAASIGSATYNTAAPTNGLIVEGSVGIGTNSPSTLLQLKQTTASHQIFSINRANSSTPALYLGNDSSQNAIISSNNSVLRFGKDLTGTFNEYVRIDTNGNVGIGTTSPGGKLDVALTYANLTASSFGLDLKVTELSGGWARSHRIYNTNYPTGTSFFGMLGGVSSVDYAYWTLDNPASVDTTGYNSTKGIFLLTTGNVGIGVTNPSQKLHVAGSLRVTGAFYDSNNDAGTSGQILKSTATGTDWVDISSLGVDGTGTTNYITKWLDSNTITNSLLFDDGTKVGIGTASPTTKLDIRSVSANQIGLQIVANSTTGQSFGARIYAGTNSSDYAFTIFNASDSANLFHVRGDGNVGIGTTVPAQRLQVVGDLGFVGGITSRMLVSYTNLTNGEDWANSPISIRERDLVNSTQSIDKYSPNLNFHWANRVSKSLWMDSNGILNWGEYDTNGIPAADGYFKTGDINFISTLKFNGVNVIYNTSTDVYVNARVIRNDSASVQDGMYIGYASTGTTAAHIRFFANGTNERMRIDANTGYVGIGTTVPAQKLHVDGNIAIQSSGIVGSGTGYGCAGCSSYSTLELYNAATGHTNLNNQGYVINLQTAGTSRLTILNNGNVGIGVTSPAAKLNVAGDILLTGEVTGNDGTRGYKLGKDSAEGGRCYLILDNDAADGIGSGTDYLLISKYGTNASIWNTDTGSLFLQTSAGTTTMLANGNVGIGTTSPATLLQIGTGTPTSQTSGIQFGDDAGARIYRSASNVVRTSSHFQAAGYIYTSSYLQTGSGNIYPDGLTNTLNINVGNAAGNAWVAGLQLTQGGNVAVYNNLTAVRLISTQATGTAPLTVSSTTVVSNLNADYLDGLHSSGFFLQSGSWAGDLTSNGFTRESGMQMTGGSEFVILSKSGQGYVLVDGSYYAYENGGFYSSYDSNYANLLGFRTDSITSIVFNPVKTTFTGSATAEDAIKTTNGRLQLGHHNSGSGVWFDTSGTARYWFAGLSGNNFRIYRGADYLTITDSGNVGIGTVSPNAKFVISNSGAQGFEFNPNASGVGQVETYNRSTSAYYSLRINADDIRLCTGSSAAERFRLDASGNVGIGTSSPAVLLHIGGSSQTTAAYGLRFGLDSNANLYRSASTTIKTDGSFVVAGTLTELSALRYKENIVPISNILDKVCQIQPISYNKKGKVEKEYGVIAEEVNELFPELISRNADGDIDSVNYSRLTVLLIQAVKELKAEVEKLKNK